MTLYQTFSGFGVEQPGFRSRRGTGNAAMLRAWPSSPTHSMAESCIAQDLQGDAGDEILDLFPISQHMGGHQMAAQGIE